MSLRIVIRPGTPIDRAVTQRLLCWSDNDPAVQRVTTSEIGTHYVVPCSLFTTYGPLVLIDGGTEYSCTGEQDITITPTDAEVSGLDPTTCCPIPNPSDCPGSGGAVTSVNGKTGAVTLTAEDTGAAPALPWVVGSGNLIDIPNGPAEPGTAINTWVRAWGDPAALNADGLVLTQTGLYDVKCTVGLPASGVQGVAKLALYHRTAGVDVVIVRDQRVASADDSTSLTVVFNVNAQAGDTVTAYVWHNADQPLTCTPYQISAFRVATE